MKYSSSQEHSFDLNSILNLNLSTSENNEHKHLKWLDRYCIGSREERPPTSILLKKETTLSVSIPQSRAYSSSFNFQTSKTHKYILNFCYLENSH